MTNSKKPQSRRDFIKQGVASAAAISPLSMFLSSMFADYVTKATAHAQSLDPAQLMSMFNFHLAGGPARWMWDLPLSPNQEIADLGNPMLITKYGGGLNGAPGVYKSVNIDGVWLPWFWSGRIPTSNGGSIEAAELARKMFMIRGVEHASDGHEINANKMLAPLAGPNVTGYVADKSPRPIPSIGLLGTAGYFNSARGLSHLNAGAGTKLLSNAMAPFIQTASPGLLINDTLASVGQPMGMSGNTEQIFDNFFSAMAQNAGGLQRYLPSSFVDRQNAKKLMKYNFAGLSIEYNRLRTKYETLISRALISSETDLKIVGIDDQPIPGDRNNPFFSMTIMNENSDRLASDSKPIYSGPDLRYAFFEDTYIINLVDSFILAEYMLSNNLSQTVIAQVSRMEDLRLDSVHITTATGLTQLTNLVGDFTVDQHYDGAAIPLLFNTRYFKAISACLYELMSVLTSKGMMQNTLINILSEFSRYPFENGVGTGHGFKGAPFTFINGRIQKPICIGNIGYESNLSGTLTGRGLWGAGAPVQEIGGRTIKSGNVASTIAAIAGVQSPSPNNQALARLEGDEIVPIITSKENVT